MEKKRIQITLEEGLQARTASLFVKKSSEYTSDIFIEKEGIKINAKSIMGLMAIGILKGDEVDIVAEGLDEEQAIDEITDFLKGLK